MNIILTAGQYAAAITAVLMCAGLFIKWAIVKPIKTYIDQATYPIQKTSNGGFSLPDVARAVHRIEANVKDLDYRLNSIEELVTKPATRSKKATN